jgi:hypothetical protein
LNFIQSHVRIGAKNSVLSVRISSGRQAKNGEARRFWSFPINLVRVTGSGFNLAHETEFKSRDFAACFAFDFRGVFSVPNFRAERRGVDVAR